MENCENMEMLLRIIYTKKSVALWYENCDVSVAYNEKYYGLWKYVKRVNDGIIR